VSPSWESRLEAARKARTDVAGESGPAASRDLPLPENVTWHRVSLVTPVLEGWKIVTGVLAFVTVQNLDELVRAYRFISEHGFTLGGGIGYYLLGLIAFIALWVGLGLLSWWRRAYAVDADGVYLRSGILSRKLRTARLPRIQSVDVVHPLLGRIFGLGQLTVEVAGGRDSRVVIGFLTTRELQTLRDRILDLAAGQIDLPGPASEGGAVGASAVGRDTRASGEFLDHAISAGLASSGIDVTRVGVLPTPAIAHLTATQDIELGVMISASHNPFPDNGIKFIARGGYKLADAVEDEIEAILGKVNDRPTGADVGRVIKGETVADQNYINHLVDSVATDLSGLRIVVDASNGAASVVGPAALRAAGAEVIVINASPDGLNINDNCGSTHPEQLQNYVKAVGADMGVAYDGDADRFAHYVRKDKIAAAAVTGRPVVALCGKVWTPGRDPSKYPVCPTCKSIYEEMRNGEGSGDGKGPRFPRFLFERGGW